MKNWIPVSSTGMTSFTMCHIAMFVKLCVWSTKRVSATCMTLSAIFPCLNEYKTVFGYSRNRFVHFALII
ncbi:MAG: hypothetical protein ACEY3L_06280 [Wolbachia sp.]